jgi:hypothetical protein
MLERKGGCRMPVLGFPEDRDFQPKYEGWIRSPMITEDARALTECHRIIYSLLMCQLLFPRDAPDGEKETETLRSAELSTLSLSLICSRAAACALAVHQCSSSRSESAAILLCPQTTMTFEKPLVRFHRRCWRQHH